MADPVDPCHQDLLDRLQQIVLDDSMLWRSLVDISGLGEFTRTLAAVARRHGLALDPIVIEHACLAARKRWLETWV